MYTGKKQINFEGPSFYQQPNQKYFRGQNVQNLRAKLSQNLSNIIQLFKERKQIIMKMAEIMISENTAKIDHIAKAKNTQLKNQARILKDQVAYNLIQTAQRNIGSNKNILQTIIDSNVKNLQIDQAKKNKTYYDQISRIEAERATTMNKFKVQSSQITKFTDQQRKCFKEIQHLQYQKISILTSKSYDHIKKAQKIQDQIQKIKVILKSNKLSKDKKKKQLSHQIDKIIEITKRHQQTAQKRFTSISQMFGGYQTIQEFDQFFRNFQTVVANKLESQKDDQKVLKEIVKLANYFQAEIQDLLKLSQDQLLLFQDLSQSFRKNLTLSLLQKAYLSNIPNDRNTLISIVGKCQSYRSVLDRLTDEKGKAKRQLQKAIKVLGYFEPQLKAIMTQERRKQQLQQKIGKIMSSRTQLQKLQRKQKLSQFQVSNLLLQKQSLSQQQQQSAKKGNLQDYIIKNNQLQKLQQQIMNFSQKNNYKFHQEQSKINLEIQQLNREYADIIQEILVDQKEMSYFAFLDKLNKRLSIN